MGKRCKMCGAELKKEGELCNNCMNQIMKEEETRNDKTIIYSFKPTFVLGYQLSKHIETIIIAVVVVAMLIYLASTYLFESILFMILVIACESLVFVYDKYKSKYEKCTFYTTKFIYKKIFLFRKREIEIRYDEVKELTCTQTRFEKAFNIGTIHIHTASSNPLQRHIFVESVRNVKGVFEDIKNKVGGDVN